MYVCFSVAKISLNENHIVKNKRLNKQTNNLSTIQSIQYFF